MKEQDHYFNEAFLQALGALGIVALYASGMLGWFLHPRFQLFTLGGAAGLALFAGRGLRKGGQPVHKAAVLAWCALLCCGTYLSQVNGGQTVPRHVKVSVARPAVDTVLVALPPEDETDELFTNIPWIVTLARRDEWDFDQAVWVRGFVVRHPVLDRLGRVALARSFMVCCAADALTFAVVMPVDKLSRYREGEWLTVRGLVQKELVSRKSRAPWENKAEIRYGKGLLLRADSVIQVDVDVPDPYVYYQVDGDFSAF